MDADPQHAPVRYADLPLVEIVPLRPPPTRTPGAPIAPLRVVISREHAPEPSDAARREWDRLTSLNPRLFPGPILAFMGLDEHRGEILARRDSYMRLAVQPTVPTGTRLLSVTAILLATDDAGREHIFMGQRAAGVRNYPSLWELGPSGGMGVPPLAVDSLDAAQIAASALDEIAEEIGLARVGGHGTPDTHGTHNSSNANEQTSAPLLLPQSPCAILRDRGATATTSSFPSTSAQALIACASSATGSIRTQGGFPRRRPRTLSAITPGSSSRLRSRFCAGWDSRGVTILDRLRVTTGSQTQRKEQHAMKKDAKKATKKAAKKAAKKSAKKLAPKKVAKKSGGLPPGMRQISTGSGASAGEIGAAVVAHLNAGNQSDKPLWDKYWHRGIVSIEGAGANISWEGRKAMEAKCDDWISKNTIHGCRAEGPYVGSTGFSVKISMDVEEKASGKRFQMDEVAVYAVKKGKVVREEFMYAGMK